MAGPPFMTDDPEPIELGHSEGYVFTTYNKGHDSIRPVQAPAAEFNTSPMDEVHLHLMVPFTSMYPGAGGTAQHGLGDVEVGIKYRPDQQACPGLVALFAPGTTDSGICALYMCRRAVVMKLNQNRCTEGDTVKATFARHAVFGSSMLLACDKS